MRGGPPSSAVLLEQPLEDDRGAVQRLQFAGLEPRKTAAEISVLARAQAREQVGAARLDRDEGGAPVGGIGGARDEARVGQTAQDPSRGGPADALDFGEPARGQRSVTLDGRQRRQLRGG